jgi:hypothetical protein
MAASVDHVPGAVARAVDRGIDRLEHRRWRQRNWLDRGRGLLKGLLDSGYRCLPIGVGLHVFGRADLGEPHPALDVGLAAGLNAVGLALRVVLLLDGPPSASLSG